MNVALWIVQGLLAFAFIAAGAMKLFAYEKYKATSEKQNGPNGLTRGLISFIGVAELAGAIGIVLPMAARGRSVAQRMCSRWACNGHAVGNCLPRASPGVAGCAGHSHCARSFCGVRAFFSMEVNKGQTLPPPVLSASGPRGRAV